MKTATDTIDYGPVPASPKHAVHLLTHVHGYAVPLREMSAIIGWNGRWENAVNACRCQKASQLLAEAAALMEEAESDGATV